MKEQEFLNRSCRLRALTFNFTPREKVQAATSAPVVSGGNLYETRKQQAGKDTNEGLARVDARKGEAQDKESLAAGNADYLESRNGDGVAVSAAQVSAMGASVGFSAAPPSAKSAAQNRGVNTVVDAWAYQGSRAALSKGQVLNRPGRQNQFRARCRRVGMMRRTMFRNEAASVRADRIAHRERVGLSRKRIIGHTERRA